MKTPHAARMAALLLLLGCAGQARGAEPAFSVEQTPPLVVRRTYDPLNPPAEMLRKLKLPEAGLCEFDFGCEIRTDTERPRAGHVTVEATITSVRMITHLAITIWTVTESTPKLRAHEEGHREICEEYYRRARDVARDIARRAVGAKLLIAEANDAAATREAQEAFQGKLLAEFLRATARRCILVQDRYDAITGHGVKPVTEADAVAQALAEERDPPNG